jgi:hypothetical protein
MGRVVILAPRAERTIALTPTTLAGLARLGITSLTLLRDGSTTAVVLDGWAFEPDRTAEATALLMRTPDRETRTFTTIVAECALRPA